jgi:hypothetical protein
MSAKKLAKVFRAVLDDHNTANRNPLMPKIVTAGAMMTCSFGAAPSALVVTPENKTLVGAPAATIMDNIPIKNISPFGMCSAPTNPTVISATAAALGVFTPMPCVPVIPAPWAPGSTSMVISGKPALHDACKCMCSWAGVIQFTAAGQFTTDVT